MMFSVLSNPERVDLSRIPRVSIATPALAQVKEVDEPRIEELLPKSNATTDNDPTKPVTEGIVAGEVTEATRPPGISAIPSPVRMTLASPSPFASEEPLAQPDCPTSCLHEVVDNHQKLDANAEAHQFASPPSPKGDGVASEWKRVESPSFVRASRTAAVPLPPPPPVSEVPSWPPQATSANARFDEEGDVLQKRTVLLDLQQLKLQHGVSLTKEWSMDDRLEDMLLEMRRHTLALDERSNVNMMRDGMRLLITGIEMVNNRMGLLDLDGWSTEACKDLNKHDANLARIYRKYWRRGTSNSPEVSIAMSLFGSMGMHHLRRTMSKNLMNRAQHGFHSRQRRPMQREDPDSSDDEAPPP